MSGVIVSLVFFAIGWIAWREWRDDQARRRDEWEKHLDRAFRKAKRLDDRSRTD